MYEIVSPIANVASIIASEVAVLQEQLAISFAPIRYELLHGKYGAYLVEEIMRFPILNAAPVTIAATIFGTSSDKNTNGEKLKNNNIFVINISLQHSIAPANVILLAPLRYPKKQVDKNVQKSKR